MTFGAAILGCDGLRLRAEETAFYKEVNPFGFILFNRNLETPDQIRALCGDLRDSVGWNAPILIDQEGGRVQRLRAPLATDWLPPLDDVARFGENASKAMYLRARITAHELRSLGIDVNCAPMLDVARDTTHHFLKNRCYSSGLKAVVDVGLSVAQGHLAGGVVPVIKHIPGHGLGQFDSHFDLPRISAPRDALEATDFAAFKPFAEMPMGMTAHLVYEAIDDQPATVSRPMIDLIRNEIGFEGLLMTDDISMEALDGTVPERGLASTTAGCDLVLHCNGDLPERQALMARIGVMTQAAQARAERALTWRTEPDPVDVAALKAEFEALLPS